MQNKTQLNKHNLTPIKSFVFGDYQSPVTSDIIPDPVKPIMMNPLIAQTQVVADKAKEYGIVRATVS
jgi:hypothetical protein